MHVIELAEPSVSGTDVRFSWTVTPHTDLYHRTEFTLSFPPAVRLGAVSPDLWWRIALLCLHTHWALLRPCRVILPVRLDAGETELWLRLTDAAVASIERGGSDDRSPPAGSAHGSTRTIELLGSGPLLKWRPTAAPTRSAGDRVVALFSGGRDGLTQAAMLRDLGERPVLVTVTSPGSWSSEHETPRRRQVLRDASARTGLELVEVRSDMRSNWRNEFSHHLGLSVNGITDGLLYLSAAIAVAAGRGAELVMMASEAEVQASVRDGGTVVQMQHFMYSAVTHGAIAALLVPAGLRIGSLTNSLSQFQVQRLLAERYPELRDLQYSCWELKPDQTACSRCAECRGIALNLATAGLSPAIAGIDLVTLLLAQHDWRPGERYVTSPQAGTASPRRLAGHMIEMQALRCLAATAPEQVAALINGERTAGERTRALEIYGTLRDRALEIELEPEPGYRSGYLELVDPTLRDGLRAVLEQHFAPEAPERYADQLANTRLLTDWITAPLRASPRAVIPVAGRPRATMPAPGGGPVTLTREELAPIRSLIPDPEPVLVPGPGGELIRVADTLLDGEELAFVTECVEGNWISSAGPYVARFERAFAAAMQCRFAVACSSGTAALHLAVAAAGIAAGQEVLVPAFTMIAAANAPRYQGALPVLVDSDAATWNLDPERLADKLTARTRAVIAVHTYGQSADMTAINDFADANGLIVIEDAAEAHGARHRGRPVGSLGRVAAFSMYGNKILTTGEGGVVTTNDEGIARGARELRDHAFSGERHFWHRRAGFNYRMTNLQAAVGLAQVHRLDELVARRMRIGRRYRQELSGIEGVTLPPELEGGVMWMFGVTVGPEFGIDRDELRRRLASCGIETRTFFVPLHLQPAYYRTFAGQRYPVAERLGRDGLYLPSGPTLSDSDIAYVTAALRANSPSGATPAPRLA